MCLERVALPFLMSGELNSYEWGAAYFSARPFCRGKRVDLTG